MRRMGTVKVQTNKRVTLPDDVIKSLEIEDGDYLDFYQSDDGKVVVEMVKGVSSEKRKEKKAPADKTGKDG